MEQAFLEGVEFCRRVVVDRLSEPVDIVVTSSAGYPLDTTFYQCVKGMMCAVPALEKGGTLIIATSLSEGIGGHEFTEMCYSLQSVAEFIDLAAERARLAKEIAAQDSDIERTNRKLSNPDFLAKAKEEVVEENRERLAEAEAAREKLRAALSRLETVA